MFTSDAVVILVWVSCGRKHTAVHWGGWCVSLSNTGSESGDLAEMREEHMKEMGRETMA